MAIPSVFKADPLFFQRLAKSAGLYTGVLDRDWGPLTDAAAAAWDKLSQGHKATYGSFDARTEQNIATLVPKAQRAARIFMQKAQDFPFTVKILSGTRTYEEQTKLYNQGRTAPGNRVTNAKAGSSNHNFGIAFDVGIFEGAKYFTGANAKENKAYVDLRKFTKAATPELAWGGDWKTIKDQPHYELRTGMSTSQVRAALEKGVAYV